MKGCLDIGARAAAACRLAAAGFRSQWSEPGHGWLVILDQHSGLPDISQRTTAEMASTPTGRGITVVQA